MLQCQLITNPRLLIVSSLKKKSYWVVRMANEGVNRAHDCTCGLLALLFHSIVTGDIRAHQVLLNRVPEQATEDSVKYQIYY